MFPSPFLRHQLNHRLHWRTRLSHGRLRTSRTFCDWGLLRRVRGRFLRPSIWGRPRVRRFWGASLPTNVQRRTSVRLLDPLRRRVLLLQCLRNTPGPVSKLFEAKTNPFTCQACSSCTSGAAFPDMSTCESHQVKRSTFGSHNGPRSCFVQHLSFLKLD